MKLVDVTTYILPVILDLRYTTSNNVVGKIIDTATTAQVDECLIPSLQKAHKHFLEDGYQIVIWSAYRTEDTQRSLLSITDNNDFVSKDSNHCRGLAIDITLADKKTGTYIEMPTDFDDFSPRAAAGATVDISSTAIKHRDYLIHVMHTYNFIVNPSEWWHFNYTT